MWSAHQIHARTDDTVEVTDFYTYVSRRILQDLSTFAVVVLCPTETITCTCTCKQVKYREG
jgi:hypothetical protein